MKIQFITVYVKTDITTVKEIEIAPKEIIRLAKAIEYLESIEKIKKVESF